MTTRYPGATWFPLGNDPAHQPLIGKVDIICLHTMVGSLPGTDEYFKHGNGEGWVGTESHFGTGPFGEIHQYTDLSRTADANLDGNDHIVSIENADTGTPYGAWSGSNVPPFTQKQMDAICELVAWLCNHYNIPAVAIPNSIKGHTGIAWHRQGVDSSPPYQEGYRVSGGEHWSDNVGKVCPGDKRIEQIKTIIIPHVAEMLKGGDFQNPWPVPGDHSAIVVDVKTRLRYAGFKGIIMDDFYGPGLRHAVKEFQLTKDELKGDADGLFGPLTWAAVQALPLPPDGIPLIQKNKYIIAAEKALFRASIGHPFWAKQILPIWHDVKQLGR